MIMRVFVGLCLIFVLFYGESGAMPPTETIVVESKIRKGDWFQELNRAIENNDNDTVKFFAKIARKTRFRGWSRELKARLLFCAVGNEWEEIVEDCADNRFDLNITNTKGKTPLLIATEKNSFNMVDYLLEAGADPNISDYRTGFTPLMVASKAGNEALVKLLIKHKAEVNVCSKLECSPLSLAIGKNYHHIVQILMDAGANVHLINKNGHTPLSMALYCHYVLAKTDQEKAESRDTARILRREKTLSRPPSLSSIPSHVRSFFKRK